jgi:DNA polymerase-1
MDAMKYHDTMLLAYLHNPNAKQLALKPLAELHLGIKPDERDAVRDWVLSNVPEASRTPKQWGKWIAEAPGELVGKYASMDTHMTKGLFDKLYKYTEDMGMLAAYERERRLIPIMLMNSMQGVKLDEATLAHDVKEDSLTLERADQWVRQFLNAPTLNIDANEDLADAIDAAGIKTASWPQTETGKRSTSKGALELVLSGEKKLLAALEYRGSLATCLRTFSEPYSKMSGRLHVGWQTTKNDGKGGTRTGRLASSPNLMNLPNTFDKVEKLLEESGLLNELDLPPLPEIRGYTVADTTDHALGAIDYSGQELKVFSHFEGGVMCKAYNDNPNLDVHQFVADLINKYVTVPVTRKQAKVLNFLTIYGGGTAKLASSLGITVPEAAAIRDAHMKALPELKELNSVLMEEWRNGDYIRTLGGRVYYVEPPTLVGGKLVTWEYKALNTAVQASSADQTKAAIVAYNDKRRYGRLWCTVHDEIVICAPKEEIRKELRILNECMINAINLDVPMTTDVEAGYRWSRMTKMEI